MPSRKLPPWSTNFPSVDAAAPAVFFSAAFVSSHLSASLSLSLPPSVQPLSFILHPSSQFSGSPPRPVPPKTCERRKGACTNDVRGGGGTGSKRDNSADRLREWDSDKGRGSKNPKFLRTLYVNGPERRSGFSKNYFTVGSISLLLLSSRRKLEGGRSASFHHND